MNLTKHQLTVLRTLQKNRQREPTVLSQLWSTKVELVTILLGFSVAYWIAPYDWMRWLVVGFAFGCVWAIFGLAPLISRIGAN